MRGKSIGLARPLMCLLALSGVLLATAIPAPQNPDENSYLSTVLALRAGRLTVPGTEALPPSPEILWFEPTPRYRVPVTTPAGATAPPLYAPLAAPFLASGGWLGLVVLQLLAFVATGLGVYVHTARFAARPHTPWLAMTTFALASFQLEYAQGIWPHHLTTALCLYAWIAGARAREVGSASAAFAAGVLIGTAAGIRYLAFCYVVLLAVTILVQAQRRARAIVAYAAGVAGPLLASAVINLARLGIFHPTTKGATYLVPGRPRTAILDDALASTWARVVDFTSWPPFRGSLHELHYLYQYDWETQVFMLWGGIKKSWLQSAPWISVVLIGLVLVWLQRRDRTPDRRELRALAIPTFGVLGVLAIFGFSRVDGGCLNQRYLLEAMPLAAIAFALLLDGLAPRRGAMLAGVALGALAAAALVAVELPLPETGRELAPPRTSPSIATRQSLEMYLPLVVAAALALCTFFSDLRGGRLMWALAGAALGWAAAIHVLEEMPGSRARRASFAELRAGVERLLPRERPAAIFAFWGGATALGPLRLDRDVHILNPWIDHWRDMPRLARHFHAEGRPVYVVCDGLLPVTRAEALQGMATDVISPSRPCLLRLLPP